MVSKVFHSTVSTDVTWYVHLSADEITKCLKLQEHLTISGQEEQLPMSEQWVLISVTIGTLTHMYAHTHAHSRHTYMHARMHTHIK